MLIAMVIATSMTAQTLAPPTPPPAECECEVIKNDTKEWCTGSRGGTYCTYLTKKGEERKYYKVKLPANKGSKEQPLISKNGKKYYWKLSKNGNWYRRYL